MADNLPVEMVQQIVLFLVDLPDIIRASAVCRQWHSALDDDEFWRQYLQLVYPHAPTSPVLSSWRADVRCYYTSCKEWAHHEPQYLLVGKVGGRALQSYIHGDDVIVCSSTSGVLKFSVSDQLSLPKLSKSKEVAPKPLFTCPHDNWARAACTDQHRLFSVGDCGFVYGWDYLTGDALCKTAPRAGGSFHDVRYHANGNWLMLAGSSRSACCWDIATQTVAPWHSELCQQTASWSVDHMHGMMVFALFTGDALIVDGQSGRQIATIGAHAKHMRCVKADAAHYEAITCGFDGAVSVLDLRKMLLREQFQSMAEKCYDLDVDPFKITVTCSTPQDHCVRMFARHRPEEMIAKLTPHSMELNGVCVQQSRMITCADDGQCVLTTVRPRDY
eukprot:TRINITY_DN11358_c0_g1_i1.p1 TRINITY_DN11358_c0_g1~~TRINITY_DN11358_c0_g1_i1.p1  ORF type:complete len:388 (+),score=77.30 TRINITY_DN11358_c0_g1_i1:24-1187(+)